MAILTEGAGSTNMNSATTAKQAVQEASPLDSFAGLAQGGLSVLGTKANADAAQAKAQIVLDDKATKFAGEQEDTALSQDLMKVSLRFDQTGDRNEAKRLSKKVLANALNSAGNDGRGDEIMSTYTKFMAVQGLGKDFYEESDAEKARGMQMDMAAKAGVQFLSTDSEAVVQAKLDNFTAFTAEGENLKRTTAELNYTNAQLTEKGKLTANESSRLALQKTKLENKQSQALSGMADGFNTILQDNFMNARETFDQTGDVNEALFQIERDYAAIRQIVSSTGGTGNASQVTALLSPMVNLYEANKRYIKGSDTKEALENTIKVENARLANLMYEKNPQLQQMIVASNLIGNTDPDLSNQIGGEVIKYLDSTMRGKYTDVAGMEPENQKAIADLAMNFIVEDTAGKTSPEQKAEGVAVIKQMFADLDKYSASVDSPQQLNQLVAMIADPRFGEWAKANGGVPASITVQVKETLKAYYSEPVMKDVVQNWEKDVAGDQNLFGFNPIPSFEGDPANAVRSLPDILEPFMTDSGLSFRAKQGAPQNLVAPALKQVNASVLPKINRLIKAMAHVEGHTDYNKVFEANYAKILGVAPDEVKAPKKEKVPLASETFVPKTNGPVKVGDIVEGVRFKGGDVADSTNWEQFNEGSTIKVGDVVNGQRYSGGGTSDPANWVRVDE
tara:strand:- start:1931 stop:3952 length:2022 start_codon:yes stop_codon:yes gene_type:complete